MAALSPPSGTRIFLIWREHHVESPIEGQFKVAQVPDSDLADQPQLRDIAKIGIVGLPAPSKSMDFNMTGNCGASLSGASLKAGRA